MQILTSLALLALCSPVQDPQPAPAPPAEKPAEKTTDKAAPAQEPKAEKMLQPKLREFPSTDGLVLTADYYNPNKDRKATVIVLFHQARWSRGEYLEIAPLLCRLGYNCLAVDLRSGEKVNGVENQSAKRAKAAGHTTEYVDAMPDIEAALLYARKHLTQGKVLAWGSSYSAGLVLRAAGTQPKWMDGVLSFAPGEYFKKQGGDWVQSAAKTIHCPTFITSAKDEHKNWKAIFDAIPGKNKQAFVPETEGHHGSRALWKKFDDSPAYRKQVFAFLAQHFPTDKHPGKDATKRPAEPAQKAPGEAK